ncbi:M12 family metallo-peptidase [Nocardioides halotolerans]|uniref:M12 family metallo-peptidase n=1 Tax=Nocardioides halotolerans TaxID=433660 RepID=UPI0003F6CCB0|nr:M12 family metallo-peptidase [Nocardioides halotolerans]
MTTARRLLALLCALFLVPLLAVTTQASSASAAGGSLFSPLDGFTVGKGGDVRVRPQEFSAYRVDLAGVRAQLAGGATTLTIPDPAGTPTAFQVREDSVMEPELQAAHPEIRTYTGADAQGSSIRLDVTPMGFHAFVRRPDGVTWLVDPAYNRRGEDRVLSYPGGSSPASGTFVERELDKTVAAVAEGGDFSTPGGLVSQRTYRMAFLTDSSYATYFGSANVFSEKTTMMNRVNEVYNDDLAIKFVLIAGTDTKLNLDTVAKMTGPNGPCGPNACYAPTEVDDCNSDTLTRNNFVIGQIMGADNFDIGHIGLGNDGGGIAGLGVVGGTNKARGCTGLPTPDGDLYAIDYVAHEVGHQMGGNHTFNSQVCQAQRNGGTSVEPGSGSSIMAYAGICGADNLQPHSDPYFSQRSVDEITNTTGATPSNLNERQSVAFIGLDNGEQFTLSCGGCPTSATLTAGSPTFAADVTAAVLAVTGQAGVVTGYDGAATAGLKGFTVTWGGSLAIPALTVQNVSGTFDPIVGTIVNGGPTTQGGTVSVTTNHSPTVTVPTAKTIPMRTPFALTGSANDADGDTLTYMWEQNDQASASASLPSNTKSSGPLFRQFGTAAIVSPTDTLEYHSPGENLAGTSPTRVFPDMAQILANNTNAATGSCPASPPAGQTTTDCYSEFLPNISYTSNTPGTKAMHFRFTARDEFTADPAADHPGGLTTGDVTVTVDTSAGPFLVTSRATAGSPGSGFETVTWNVAGTAAASLAPNVKISLSTDGGLTFPTVLAASTPNDGSEVVILPSVTTTTARIKIEAVDNYFFDVNDANFAINPSAGNLTPIVDAGPDATVAVGATFTSSGSFMDEAPGTATATVDYGDGAGPVPLTLTGSTFNLSHTYTTVGPKTVTVAVTDASAATGTDTATVTVTSGTPPGPAASTVKAAAKPKKPVQGHGFKVKATVTSSGGVAAGTVQVYLGTKLLGTGTLKNGKVTIKLKPRKAKKLKVGKNTLTVKYLGSATIAASQADLVVKIKKKKH